MKLWPFKVVETADGKPAIEVMVGDEVRRLLPQVHSAMLIR